MRKENIKIKCPKHILFGDPMYFEEYKNDPEKLQKLVVDYSPQPGFKAGVSLVETEHPEYPGFIARTMTIYFAPEQYLSIYMDGKMYASQKIDRKKMALIRHATGLRWMDDMRILRQAGTAIGGITRNCTVK